jgi:hypothetical protein
MLSAIVQNFSGLNEGFSSQQERMESISLFQKQWMGVDDHSKSMVAMNVSAGETSIKVVSSLKQSAFPWVVSVGLWKITHPPPSPIKV